MSSQCACSFIECPYIVNLRVLDAKLYSLTLKEWSESAGLSSKFHPALELLSLQSVNLQALDNDSRFPPGIIGSDFPATLGTVYIASCNLTELPENLDQIWPPGINMLFKANGLVKISDVIFRMRLLRLSVAQYQLREIPVQLFEPSTLKWFDVTENMLLSFPPQAQVLSSELMQLNFESTNMSRLPEWMLTPRFQSQVAAYGGDAPFCDALLKRNDAQLRTHQCASQMLLLFPLDLLNTH